MEYLKKYKNQIIIVLIALAVIAGVWFLVANYGTKAEPVEETQTATTTPEVITPVEYITKYINVVDTAEIDRLNVVLADKDKEINKLSTEKLVLQATINSYKSQVSSLSNSLSQCQEKYNATFEAQMSQLADQLENAFNEDRTVRDRIDRADINRAINRAVNRISR